MGSVAGAGEGADGGQSTSAGFGFPVGDLQTFPAGGWAVGQVLSHYYPAGGGRHLAVDVSSPAGGAAAIGQPVHAVGDGEVLYAGPNGTTYKNVVLIRHALADGSSVCSFYGHITSPIVATGDHVTRGQVIASVIDWQIAAGGPSSNSHLHYVLLSSALCEASAAAGGGSVCGYDTGGANGVDGQGTEPSRYTSAGDVCGDQAYADGFISPTQFIADHAAAP